MRSGLVAAPPGALAKFEAGCVGGVLLRHAELGTSPIVAEL
jgi:hypothetical protein